MSAIGRVYYVYILASRINGTLYIGVTNNLLRRATEHREYMLKGFTKTYKVTVRAERSMGPGSSPG